MTLKQIADFCSRLTASMASLLKVAILSKRPSPKEPKRDKAITIMGNGPSLKTAMHTRPELFTQNDLMAVNFAPNTPEFFTLRPSLLILADSHFFAMPSTDPNVGKLWENIARTDWPLTLWVPCTHTKTVAKRLKHNGNIKIKSFNLTPVEGLRGLSEWLFDIGAGMPRPRNVLIPAIMTAMRSGYDRIYLTGADHSWSKTLWVDNLNRVISIQPHYYKDDSKELDRVASEYAGYHLHDIYTSLAIAFRSYHIIAPYARRKGVEIINASDGSFIDAFPRL